MTFYERFIEKQKNILAKMLIDTDIDSREWDEVVPWVHGAKTVLMALEDDMMAGPEWLLDSGPEEPPRYKCSYCRSKVTDLRLESDTPDFCPYCGSYMKGRKQNE